MIIINDKFELSREDNVFVAKKYLKDSVYRSAFLEGIAVTFPQTEAIIENAEVSGVSPKDISKVCDLRDSWRFILDNLDTPVDLAFLQNLHQIIAREDVPWNKLGVLRIENVRISGTNYLPELPNAEEIQRDLTKISEDTERTDTDKAISTALYLMRAQLFLDGNKRIGTLVGNKMLIEKGRGIFSLPPEMKQTFSEKLIHFYETNDDNDLKQFIFDNCLTGM